jgi:hypothetical protein
MTLRDQITLDLPVFLEPGEFAEQLTVDGVLVTCVFDEDSTIPRTQGPEAEGVFTLSSSLFCQVQDLVPRPVEGQQLLIGAQRWYVRRVAEAQGMLRLELERQET